MVLSESPRPIRLVRAAVPDDLARVIERCLEKDPAARYGSVAELAAALEPYAPADSRGLAMRIARITSGGRVFAPPPATALRPVQVPTHTTANWSARAGLARSSRGRLVALAVVGSVAAAAAVIGAVGSLRSHIEVTPQALRSTSQTSTPTPTSTSTSTPTPLTSFVAASPPVADAGGGHLARPHQNVVAPVDSAPSNEPPKYRTSW
jgi:hypothetical protein